MRTYDEAYEAAADEPAFSNGTEGYAWLGNWCGRCVHDKPSRQDRPEDGCPLIVVSLMQRTPSEWIRQDGNYLGDTYHCVEFRDEDNPGPSEPTPIPDPPGQELLLPREPFEGTRMFVQPTEVEVAS